MPNLDPGVNQNEDMTTKTINKFENHLLSIKTERQKMIHPNSHPTYNERQQKIIEMIDWTLEKYKTTANIKMTDQEKGEQEVIIIEDIIQELDKKRKIILKKLCLNYLPKFSNPSPIFPIKFFAPSVILEPISLALP